MLQLITHTHTPALGRTSLDEKPARRRELYLHKTHNSQKTQKSMPPAGFEPAIPASQQQTHALDRAATGIGDIKKTHGENKI